MEENWILGSWYWLMPNAVLFDKRLTDKQKLLYCLITSLSAEKWYCRASNKYLWEKLDSKERTISNSIKALIEFWYIESEVSQDKWNERCIKICSVRNHNTSCEKSHDLLWNFTWPSCEKSQHNNINIIIQDNNYSELYENYYWKSKGIDTKVCDKLIKDKLNKWLTLDDIKQWLILYNCECRTKWSGAYKYVKKFETWIKEFQPITDEDIARVVSLHREKTKADEKYASKVWKIVISDLCEAFWRDRINQLWKAESKSVQLHFT